MDLLRVKETFTFGAEVARKGDLVDAEADKDFVKRYKHFLEPAENGVRSFSGGLPADHVPDPNPLANGPEVDVDSANKAELEAAVANRGIEIERGTGKDGNVTVEDLRYALEHGHAPEVEFDAENASREDLEAEVANRGIEVERGTGDDGEVTDDDLRYALERGVGPDVPDPAAGGAEFDVQKANKAELEAEATRRGLDVEGTGKDGAVTVPDLRKALS
jgi:hypothetical protein